MAPQFFRTCQQGLCMTQSHTNLTSLYKKDLELSDHNVFWKFYYVHDMFFPICAAG